MNAATDELAGVVDLFGGLTRAELERALTEVAFRADGQALDDTALEQAIEDALESFALIRCDAVVLDGRATDGDHAVTPPLFVTGPTAFPKTPAHGDDLPHILEVTPRRLDRARLAEVGKQQFVDSLESACSASPPDRSRLEWLLDVSYEFEAWAPIELSTERERIVTILEDA